MSVGRLSVVLVVLGIAIATVGSLRRHPPDLHVDAQSLSLGTVLATDELSTSMTVRNSTAVGVTVESMISSCACTAISPSSFHLSAGESAPISLRLRLLAPASHINAESWPLEAVIVPQIKGRSTATKWTLTGTVRNVIFPSQASIRFADGDLLRVGSTTTSMNEDPKAVIVRCSRDVTELRSESTTEDFATATVEEGTGQYRLTIMPSPYLTVGRHRSTCRLRASTESGANSIVELPIEAQVQHDLFVRDDSLSAGYVKVGEEAVRMFTVASRSQRSFRIDAVTCVEQWAKPRLVALEASQSSKRIGVAINLVSKGLASQWMVIRYRYENDKTHIAAAPDNEVAFRLIVNGY